MVAAALFSLTSLSVFGVTVGPEVPVAGVGPGMTPHVAISRHASRTILTWDESAGPGQLSRIMTHRQESLPGFGPRLGAQTFAAFSSPRNQKSPALGSGLVAWVEEDPTGSGIIGSVWYQPLEFWEKQTYAPHGEAEKLGEATRDSKLAVLNYHVFHAIVWTGLDGRLMAAERSLIARIGFDQRPWSVTTDNAINPAVDGTSGNTWPLIAYNTEVPTLPGQGHPPVYVVRATALGGRQPQPAIYLTAPGSSASAPDVVANESDWWVLWSMDDNGGTFAIRVKTAGGIAATVGNLKKVHAAELHDASSAPNDEIVMVVEEAQRFLFLRLDRDLNVLESVPFQATLAADTRVKVSADSRIAPMLTYTSFNATDGSSRVVYRLVEDAPSFRKRRSAR